MYFVPSNDINGGLRLYYMLHNGHRAKKTVTNMIIKYVNYIIAKIITYYKVTDKSNVRMLEATSFF